MEAGGGGSEPILNTRRFLDFENLCDDPLNVHVVTDLWFGWDNAASQWIYSSWFSVCIFVQLQITQQQGLRNKFPI